MKKKEYKNFLEKEIYFNIKSSGLKKILLKIYLTHFNPSTNSIYLIRKMQYYYHKGILKNLLSYRIRNKLIQLYGINIEPSSIIDVGLRIPHPTSIVIGSKTIIGKNFTIYQSTTIGGARSGDAKIGNQPQIGDNCTVYCGGMILGNIKVGKNTIIGANSTLLIDADENSVYVGSPAFKVCPKDKNRTL